MTKMCPSRSLGFTIPSGPSQPSQPSQPSEPSGPPRRSVRLQQPSTKRAASLDPQQPPAKRAVFFESYQSLTKPAAPWNYNRLPRSALLLQTCRNPPQSALLLRNHSHLPQSVLRPTTLRSLVHLITTWPRNFLNDSKKSLASCSETHAQRSQPFDLDQTNLMLLPT